MTKTQVSVLYAKKAYQEQKIRLLRKELEDMKYKSKRVMLKRMIKRAELKWKDIDKQIRRLK